MRFLSSNPSMIPVLMSGFSLQPHAGLSFLFASLAKPGEIHGHSVDRLASLRGTFPPWRLLPLPENPWCIPGLGLRNPLQHVSCSLNKMRLLVAFCLPHLFAPRHWTMPTGALAADLWRKSPLSRRFLVTEFIRLVEPLDQALPRILICPRPSCHLPLPPSSFQFTLSARSSGPLTSPGVF